MHDTACWISKHGLTMFVFLWTVINAAVTLSADFRRSPPRSLQSRLFLLSFDVPLYQQNNYHMFTLIQWAFGTKRAFLLTHLKSEGRRTQGLIHHYLTLVSQGLRRTCHLNTWETWFRYTEYLENWEVEKASKMIANISNMLNTDCLRRSCTRCQTDYQTGTQCL